jgi:hypothetical protein
MGRTASVPDALSPLRLLRGAMRPIQYAEGPHLLDVRGAASLHGHAMLNTLGYCRG